MAAKRKKAPSQAGRPSKIVPRAKISKNLWLLAVDPFGDLNLNPIWQLLLPLAKRSRASIRAVYILAPNSLNWVGDFSGPWMKKYRPAAEAKLAAALPDPAIDKTVVPCKTTGQRAAVNALITYAKKVKADRLLITTHARTGLDRLAMGSFAETLILTSPVPVLVMNPSHQLPANVRKILVPTDLSQKSKKFVTAIADHAKEIDAEVVLYHKQLDLLDPMMQQGVYSLGGGWVSVQNFVDDDCAAKNQQIEKLEKQFRQRRIRVGHVLDSAPGGLVECIERAAADNAVDMISIFTQAGPWSAALLGSVARGLVRTSQIPVLIGR